MKQELIEIVKQLKELIDSQDDYLETVPEDIRDLLFDNKYAALQDLKLQLVMEKLFEDVDEDIYWFLYDFEAGAVGGPHIIKESKEYYIKSNEEYYEYLRGA
jgi:hypothetical protein